MNSTPPQHETDISPLSRLSSPSLTHHLLSTFQTQNPFIAHFTTDLHLLTSSSNPILHSTFDSPPTLTDAQIKPSQSSNLRSTADPSAATCDQRSQPTHPNQCRWCRREVTPGYNDFYTLLQQTHRFHRELAHIVKQEQEYRIRMNPEGLSLLTRSPPLPIIFAHLGSTMQYSDALRASCDGELTAKEKYAFNKMLLAYDQHVEQRKSAPPPTAMVNEDVLTSPVNDIISAALYAVEFQDLPDCVKKTITSCPVIHPCGCFCTGVRGECIYGCQPCPVHHDLDQSIDSNTNDDNQSPFISTPLNSPIAQSPAYHNSHNHSNSNSNGEFRHPLDLLHETCSICQDAICAEPMFTSGAFQHPNLLPFSHHHTPHLNSTYQLSTASPQIHSTLLLFPPEHSSASYSAPQFHASSTPNQQPTSQLSPSVPPSTQLLEAIASLQQLNQYNSTLISQLDPNHHSPSTFNPAPFLHSPRHFTSFLDNPRTKIRPEEGIFIEQQQQQDNPPTDIEPNHLGSSGINSDAPSSTSNSVPTRSTKITSPFFNPLQNQFTTLPPLLPHLFNTPRQICTHSHHYLCFLDQIQHGLLENMKERLNFNFLKCNICRSYVFHPLLLPKLLPYYILEQQIQLLALGQLFMETFQYNQLTKPLCRADMIRLSAGIQECSSDYAGNAYYKRPDLYAMDKLVYYMCEKCHKPYYGGLAECRVAADVEALPDVVAWNADNRNNNGFNNAQSSPNPTPALPESPQKVNVLLCSQCNPASGKQCQHDESYLLYKCRFCCSAADFVCWGNTYFCRRHHSMGVWHGLVNQNSGLNRKRLIEYEQCPSLRTQFDQLKAVHGDNAGMIEGLAALLKCDKDTCPLGVSHPPNGINFVIGCSECGGIYGKEDSRNEELATPVKDQTVQLSTQQSFTSPENTDTTTYPPSPQFDPYFHLSNTPFFAENNTTPFSQLSLYSTLSLLHTIHTHLDISLTAHCYQRRSVTKLFQYLKDTNGLLFYLGTLANSHQYLNPHKRGLLECSSTTLAINSLPAWGMLHRFDARCAVSPPKHHPAFFQIDLKLFKIIPTGYSFSHYSSHDMECVRSWNLEGSNDGVNFITISAHHNDSSLKGKNSAAYWNITGYTERVQDLLTQSILNKQCNGTNRISSSSTGLLTPQSSPYADFRDQMLNYTIEGVYPDHLNLKYHQTQEPSQKSAYTNKHCYHFIPPEISTPPFLPYSPFSAESESSSLQQQPTQSSHRQQSPNGHDGFRYFRLVTNALNDNNGRYLPCVGFELYGALVLPSYTDVFNAIEELNAQNTDIQHLQHQTASSRRKHRQRDDQQPPDHINTNNSKPKVALTQSKLVPLVSPMLFTPTAKRGRSTQNEMLLNNTTLHETNTLSDSPLSQYGIFLEGLLRETARWGVGVLLRSRQMANTHTPFAAHLQYPSSHVDWTAIETAQSPYAVYLIDAIKRTFTHFDPNNHQTGSPTLPTLLPHQDTHLKPVQTSDTGYKLISLPPTQTDSNPSTTASTTQSTPQLQYPLPLPYNVPEFPEQKYAIKIATADNLNPALVYSTSRECEINRQQLASSGKIEHRTDPEQLQPQSMTTPTITQQPTILSFLARLNGTTHPTHLQATPLNPATMGCLAITASFISRPHFLLFVNDYLPQHVLPSLHILTEVPPSNQQALQYSPNLTRQRDLSPKVDPFRLISPYTKVLPSLHPLFHSPPVPIPSPSHPHVTSAPQLYSWLLFDFGAYRINPTAYHVNLNIPLFDQQAGENMTKSSFLSPLDSNETVINSIMTTWVIEASNGDFLDPIELDMDAETSFAQPMKLRHFHSDTLVDQCFSELVESGDHYARCKLPLYRRCPENGNTSVPDLDSIAYRDDATNWTWFPLSIHINDSSLRDHTLAQLTNNSIQTGLNPGSDYITHILHNQRQQSAPNPPTSLQQAQDQQQEENSKTIFLFKKHALPLLTVPLAPPSQLCNSDMHLQRLQPTITTFVCHPSSYTSAHPSLASQDPQHAFNTSFTTNQEYSSEIHINGGSNVASITSILHSLHFPSDLSSLTNSNQAIPSHLSPSNIIDTFLQHNSMSKQNIRVFPSNNSTPVFPSANPHKTQVSTPKEFSHRSTAKPRAFKYIRIRSLHHNTPLYLSTVDFSGELYTTTSSLRGHVVADQPSAMISPSTKISTITPTRTTSLSTHSTMALTDNWLHTIGDKATYGPLHQSQLHVPALQPVLNCIIKAYHYNITQMMTSKEAGNSRQLTTSNPSALITVGCCSEQLHLLRPPSTTTFSESKEPSSPLFVQIDWERFLSKTTPLRRLHALSNCIFSPNAKTHHDISVSGGISTSITAFPSSTLFSLLSTTLPDLNPTYPSQLSTAEGVQVNTCLKATEANFHVLSPYSNLTIQPPTPTSPSALLLSKSTELVIPTNQTALPNQDSHKQSLPHPQSSIFIPTFLTKLLKSHPFHISHHLFSPLQFNSDGFPLGTIGFLGNSLGTTTGSASFMNPSGDCIHHSRLFSGLCHSIFTKIANLFSNKPVGNLHPLHSVIIQSLYPFLQQPSSLISSNGALSDLNHAIPHRFTTNVITSAPFHDQDHSPQPASILTSQVLNAGYHLNLQSLPPSSPFNSHHSSFPSSHYTHRPHQPTPRPKWLCAASDKFIILDFGPHTRIIPTAYSLSIPQYNPALSQTVPRNWQLLASIDANLWHLLANHSDDPTLSHLTPTAVFHLPPAQLLRTGHPADADAVRFHAMSHYCDEIYMPQSQLEISSIQTFFQQYLLPSGSFFPVNAFRFFALLPMPSYDIATPVKVQTSLSNPAARPSIDSVESLSWTESLSTKAPQIFSLSNIEIFGTIISSQIPLSHRPFPINIDGIYVPRPYTFDMFSTACISKVQQQQQPQQQPNTLQQTQQFLTQYIESKTNPILLYPNVVPNEIDSTTPHYHTISAHQLARSLFSAKRATIQHYLQQTMLTEYNPIRYTTDQHTSVSASTMTENDTNQINHQNQTFFSTYNVHLQQVFMQFLNNHFAPQLHADQINSVTTHNQTITRKHTPFIKNIFQFISFVFSNYIHSTPAETATQDGSTDVKQTSIELIKTPIRGATFVLNPSSSPSSSPLSIQAIASFSPPTLSPQLISTQANSDLSHNATSTLIQNYNKFQSAGESPVLSISPSRIFSQVLVTPSYLATTLTTVLQIDTSSPQPSSHPHGVTNINYPLDLPSSLLLGSTNYAIITGHVLNPPNQPTVSKNDSDNVDSDVEYDDDDDSDDDQINHRPSPSNLQPSPKLTPISNFDMKDHNVEYAVIIDAGVLIQPRSYTISHANLNLHRVFPHHQPQSHPQPTIHSVPQIALASGETGMETPPNIINTNDLSLPTLPYPPPTLISTSPSSTFMMSPEAHFTTTGFLRNWQLLASTDGLQWHIISVHVKDSTISSPNVLYTFPTTSTAHTNADSRWYRYFKLRLTGVNSAQQWTLCLSSFDINGLILLEFPVKE